MHQKRAVSKVVVAIVIVALVIAGVAAYFATSGGLDFLNPSSKPTTKPTPESSPVSTSTPKPGSTSTPASSSSASPIPTSGSTSTPEPTPGPTIGGLVAGATSLQFTVQYYAFPMVTKSYVYYAKNLGRSDVMLRCDATETSPYKSTMTIVNAVQHKAWTGADSGSMSDVTASKYEEYMQTLLNDITKYQASLSGWSGTSEPWIFGTDTASGATIQIVGVMINPQLTDTVFQA
jgi:hypothetical protein